MTGITYIENTLQHLEKENLISLVFIFYRIDEVSWEIRFKNWAIDLIVMVDKVSDGLVQVESSLIVSKIANEVWLKRVLLP